MTTFAEFFNQRINELNVTQSDVARELNLLGYGITRAAVSAWATGRRVPDIRNPKFRRALAKVLQVDTVTLLKQLGYAVDHGHSPEAQQAAEIIDELPDNMRRLALDMVRMLKNR